MSNDLKTCPRCKICAMLPDMELCHNCDRKPLTLLEMDRPLTKQEIERITPEYTEEDYKAVQRWFLDGFTDEDNK